MRAAILSFLDDPHNVKQAESEAVRDETVRQLNLAVYSRVRQRHGSVICIMQRLHERDFAASMLQRPDTVHLCLPARFEPDHPHLSRPITLPSGRVLPGDPRTKAGEPLFPALWPEDRIAALELSLGEYGSSGQLQQRPSPRQGGLFKRDWLKKRCYKGSALALSPDRARLGLGRKRG